MDCVYQWLCGTLLDVRFQALLGLGLLAQWAWRLPRPRKGAGNRAVFITGCDFGPSHWIARRFDEMGLHVFAGCLRPDAEGARMLKEECSTRLHVVPIDTSRDDTIEEAVAYVRGNLPAGEKGLYGLVNGADLMTTERCEEGVTGAMRVTEHFLPLISQAQGRIVTVTNILRRESMPAVCSALAGLRCDLLSTRVKVSLVEHPTDIVQWSQKHLDGNLSNLTLTTQKEKLHMASKRIQRAKSSPKSPETNYRYLLEDVEDAMLAEEPYFKYISAPFNTRIKLWLSRNLSDELFNLLCGSLSE